jgi:hypothetical protein
LIIAGIFMGVSGFVALLIPLINRFRDEEKDVNEENTTKRKSTTIRSDSSEC